MAKRTELEVTLDVDFVPMPEEHVSVWRAGMLLLLEILEKDVDHERMGSGGIGDVDPGITALLPLEEVVEGA